MRANWKTTVGGVLAAIGQALSATGVLPPPWGTVAGLVAALGLALLGTSAADRPKNNALASPKALN